MSQEHLQIPITREALITWGADQIYSAKHLDRWLHHQESLPLSSFLEIDTASGRLFWAIMRPEILEPALIHQCGIDLAQHHLALVDERGDIYVDLRSRKTPKAKQAWLDGDLSLGGLMYAQRRAQEAQRLVAELDDTNAHNTAHILAVLTETEPCWTFRQMFYRHADVFPGRDAEREVIELVRARIQSW